MSELLPEWFAKMFAERKDIAIRRIASARETEQLWSAQGAIAALTDLENEIDLVRLQIAEDEKKAVEGFLKSDA